MAYDSIRGVVVLFGGDTEELDSGETWEWDGDAWTLVATQGPSPRYRASMVFDESRGVVVLFGGTGGGCAGRCGDTWEWDGQTWAETQAPSPPKRREHAMVYHPTAETVLLHGGIDNFPIYDDTWVRDGSVWQQVNAGIPSARVWHEMAFDSIHDEAVLFGGQPAAVGRLSDTWVWDHQGWHQRFVAGPSARNHHEMWFDDRLGRVVLFGGSNESNQPLGDLWTWDGSEWAQVESQGPSARWGHELVFDSHRGVGVLFGGLDASGTLLGDTWEVALSTQGPRVRWPLLDGGNGNSYMAFAMPAGITWTAAAALAEQCGGHLATLTSGAERDWVLANVASDASLWRPTGEAQDHLGPWIGGYQDRAAPDFSEPAGGWRWVTQEPWGDTNWAPAEPNNAFGIEDYLVLFSKSGEPDSMWNDYPDDDPLFGRPIGLIIEFERCLADLTGSTSPLDPDFGIPDGKVDSEDFFFYLDLFAAGHPLADLTGSSNPFDPGYGVPDGTIDADDFFVYLDYFAAGC